MDYKGIKNTLMEAYHRNKEKLANALTINSGLELVAVNGYNGANINSKIGYAFRPSDSIVDYTFFSKKKGRCVNNAKVSGNKVVVNMGDKTVTLNPGSIKHNTVDYVGKKLPGIDKPTRRKIAKQLEKLLKK